MRMYICPHCQESSISFREKYKAGYWGNIHCAHCKAKLCAYPLILATLWVLYVWDVGWFAGLYYYTSNVMHFVYMAVVWVIVDFINVSYIPLAVMKQAPQP